MSSSSSSASHFSYSFCSVRSLFLRPHHLVMTSFPCHYAKDRFVFLKKKGVPKATQIAQFLFCTTDFLSLFGKSTIGHFVSVYRYVTLVVAINLTKWLTRSTWAVPENKPGHLHLCAEVVLAFQKAPAVQQNQPRHLFIRTQERLHLLETLQGWWNVRDW